MGLFVPSWFIEGGAGRHTCVLSLVWTPGLEHWECLCACGPGDPSQSASSTPPTWFSGLRPSSVVTGDRNWCCLLQPKGGQRCSHLPELGGAETAWMEELYGGLPQVSPRSSLPLAARLPSWRILPGRTPLPASPLLFGPWVRLEVPEREASGSQGRITPTRQMPPHGRRSRGAGLSQPPGSDPATGTRCTPVCRVLVPPGSRLRGASQPLLFGARTLGLPLFAPFPFLCIPSHFEEADAYCSGPVGVPGFLALSPQSWQWPCHTGVIVHSLPIGKMGFEEKVLIIRGTLSIQDTLCSPAFGALSHVICLLTCEVVVVSILQMGKLRLRAFKVLAWGPSSPK